jgi:hypothetical protein
MSNGYRSEIDLSLGQVPLVEDPALYEALQEVYSSLQILAASVQPITYNSIDIDDHYTVAPDDQLVRADSTAADVVVTLPLSATCINRRYTIKRINASGATVTLRSTGSERVDGSSAINIPNMETIEVQAGADYWDIVSKS